MGQTVTLGGERLGSGNKQKVELHNYEMTSFNLEQDFKSTMAPGILYPFMRDVATNHGTYDIDLDALVRTLPTKGPLFGSFKMQVDIFAVPMRLYQGILHNNPIKVGLNMDKIFLPKIRVSTTDGASAPRVKESDEDDYQVNNTALIKYNGISGIGKDVAHATTGAGIISRKFQCIPELAYYDIFKNYYANKQEEYAYVITPGEPTETQAIWRLIQGNVTEDMSQVIADYDNGTYNGESLIVSKDNVNSLVFQLIIDKTNEYTTIEQYLRKININGVEETISLDEANPETNGIKILNAQFVAGNRISIALMIANWQAFIDYITTETESELTTTQIDFETFYQTNYYAADIKLTPFKLENIDDMRNALLSNNTIGKEFVIGDVIGDDWTPNSGSDETGLPYSALINTTHEGITWNAFVQNGLVVKTYQSDLFNNWLDTEYIDGESGISAISSVAVVGDKFTMDSLNLAEKIYEYLNRVLVAGGTYEDWQEATYGQGAVRKAETPMYVGGMSSEVLFEEVIATTSNTQGDNRQALGDLGGRGRQGGMNGGNNIHIKCDEPSYIIGIVSLTPRICYSQGNDWDRTELDTMDDLHKPALDGIGFQDLMVEQMAWWNVAMDGSTILGRQSAGKQIAWINYQTKVDKCFGDFAKADGYGFMVLGRHYEHDTSSATGVKDITTYIDPVKYNYAFAYSELDAQNFWVQIHCRMTARRKMAGKQIPNI